MKGRRAEARPKVGRGGPAFEFSRLASQSVLGDLTLTCFDLNKSRMSILLQELSLCQLFAESPLC